MQTSEKIAIRTRDGGTMSCYMAKANKESAPAIIVIQEIFGVTKFLKSSADWLAAQGFHAVVPDLFWRLEPDLELNDRDPEQKQKAFKLFGEFNQSQGIEDLKDVVSHLKTDKAVSGKVGCVGYCLGGLMAYLMACRSEVQTSVSYYGVGIDEHLSEADNIKAPTMLHIAGKDAFVPAEKLQKIKNVLDPNPLATIHVYPEMDHAFCRVGGEHYDKETADTANTRTLQFFAENLK
jgi:carboxymethylenebutenolidase